MTSKVEELGIDRSYTHSNIEMLRWEIHTAEQKLKELREKLVELEVELNLLDMLIDHEDRKQLIRVATVLEDDERRHRLERKPLTVQVPINETRRTAKDIEFLNKPVSTDEDAKWICTPPPTAEPPDSPFFHCI